MPLGLKRYQQEGHLHVITFSYHHRRPHLHPSQHPLRANPRTDPQMLQPRSPRLRPHPRARPPPPQRTHHRAPRQGPPGPQTPRLQTDRHQTLLATPLLRLQRLHRQEAPRKAPLHARQPGHPRPVHNPEDWPHSSAHHYLTGALYPIIHLTSPHSLKEAPIPGTHPRRNFIAPWVGTREPLPPTQFAATNFSKSALTRTPLPDTFIGRVQSE